MGLEVEKWIDVTLDRGRIGRYHRHNSAHLSHKNATGYLAFWDMY